MSDKKFCPIMRRLYSDKQQQINKCKKRLCHVFQIYFINYEIHIYTRKQ